MDYLYRGVSEDMHTKGVGLAPKGKNRSSFTYYDCAISDSNETYDDSPENSMILHQRDSDKFLSAYISTTPHYSRAKYYALSNSCGVGYIYKLNCSLLKKYNVEAKTIKEVTLYPEKPEDDEVLLVTKDNGVLPSEIIDSIEKVHH